MAWVTSQIFVKGTDQRAAVDAVTGLIEAARRAFLQASGHPSPPSGAVCISPPCDGWLRIHGSAGWAGDLCAAAQALSVGGPNLEVVASEILGHAYQLRHLLFRNGEEVAREMSPEILWRASRPRRYLMPLYRDVEQLGLALLLDLGIPPSLILAGASSTPEPQSAPINLGLGVQVRLGDKGRTEEVAPFRVGSFKNPEAPVIPRHIGREFGFALFDDRFTEGRPTEESVRRLLHLEEKIAGRASRQFGRSASVSFAYHNGEYQEELDAQLRAVGISVPPRPRRSAAPPWWQFWRHFGRWR